MPTPSIVPLRAILALVLLVPLVWSSDVEAARKESVDGDPDGEAALIRKGIELRQKGQDEAALQEFRRAYDRSSSPRALAQIALAEQALGRWLEAEDHLSGALRQTQDLWIGHNKKHLSQALVEIQGHLGSLELTGDSKEGKVMVNGQQVATLPLSAPLRVLAGSIALEVQAVGFQPVVRTVVVPGGGLAREPLVFVPVATVPKPAPKRATTEPAEAGDVTPGAEKPIPHPNARGTRQTVGAVVGAGALAALATGIGFYLKHESDAKSYNNDTSCHPTFGPPASYCQSKYDTVNSDKYVIIAGLASAAILGGVGTYLFLSSGGADSEKAHETAFRLQCSPTAGLGMICSGRF
jgi:tetratricopeptide (TPR) repeat protein